MNLNPFLRQEKAVHSALERQYIDRYLGDQGYSRADLATLPPSQAKRLLAAASVYASSKLAEIESRSKFMQKLT